MSTMWFTTKMTTSCVHNILRVLLATSQQHAAAIVRIVNHVRFCIRILHYWYNYCMIQAD